MSEDKEITEYPQLVKEIEVSQKLREFNALSYNVIEFQLKGLEGETLTIIDACLSDLQQRNAVKDLVKHMFRKKYSWLKELCYGGGVRTKESLEVKDSPQVVSVK